MLLFKRYFTEKVQLFQNMKKNNKVLVTGAGGLVGSEAARFFVKKGFNVYGIDNNMRKTFFGEKGSTIKNIVILKREYDKFKNFKTDVRKKKTKYCIGIPIINEGQRIKKQLKRMKRYADLADIVVFDGGSTDNSIDKGFFERR